MAQTGTAGVEGTIHSADRTALAEVVVTVHNRDTGLRRVTRTGPDGRFLLPNLPVDGEYDLRAESPGFAAATVDGLRLRTPGRVVVDVVLQVAVADVVTVGGESQTVDRQHSTVQQTVDEQLLRALPLFNRDFLQVSSLAAGFTGHPDYPSAQGQMYWTHNVLVDGASHFSKWRGAARAFYSGYSLESIREVQVLTNLFSAASGESLASVTSALTKAGTNRWHGSALLFVRDDALDAVPAFAPRTPPGGAQQYAASIGGPIVRDRTHVWAGFEGRRSRDRNIVISPAAPGALVPDDQDEQLASVRIDHQQSSRQLVTARYNTQLFGWRHEPGGLSLPGTGTRFTNNVHTVYVSDSLQPSDHALNELRLQVARYVDRRRDLQPTVYVSRAGYSVEGGALGPTGFGADPEDTWEAADTFTHWSGGHTLTAGGGIKHVRARNASFGYGRGAYFYAGSPDLHPQPFLYVQGLAASGDATVAEPRSVSSFGFVQDDWTVRPRVTLNLGLRYDLERVSNVRGFQVAADTNNVQPRVGAAWDVRGQGRTVVRGGAGLYTQQHLLYTINRVELEGADGVRTVSLGAGSGTVLPTFPATLPVGVVSGAALPPGDLFRAGAAYRNPYSIQSALGVQQLLFGAVIGVDYVRLDGRDLTSLIDVNAPASNIKPAQRTVGDADATRPSVPLPGAYRKLITLGNKGRSWYQALQVKASRSLGSWQTMASYTLSRAEDMANAELPEDSRSLRAEKARASTDVRHNLSMGATWALPGYGRLLRGWSISGVGLFRSNRPYTISWGDDRNGTTQGDARPGGRNEGRTGPFRTVNVAFARRFRGPRATVEGRLEAFNLFNATNYDQYVGELLSSLFGKPVSAFPQRRLQLAAIVRF